MKIQMICIDLDGTALNPDHKTFSPRLLADLEEAHRRGIAIIPVTGRQYGLLPEALLQHPVWEELAVLCNGGQIRRLGSGQVLQRLDIPQEALHQLLALAERFRLPIEFSVDSRLHLTRRSLALQQEDPTLRFHRETILPKCGVLVEDPSGIFHLGVEKVNLLCISDAVRSEVELAMNSIDVCAVWSSAHAMEITHAKASKGAALETVCGLMSIPPENVLALGDSGNDESMLRMAGLGVAMGSAPEAIKAIADAITDTNHSDGAAKAIERYVLQIP